MVSHRFNIRGGFYSAALKAFLVKLYLPVYLVLCIAFVAIFSFRIVPDLAVVFVTTVLQTLIAYKMINNEDYPFSQPFKSMQQGVNTDIYFLLIIFVAAFAGLHYLATRMQFGIYIYLVILVVATVIAWKTVFSKKQ